MAWSLKICNLIGQYRSRGNVMLLGNNIFFHKAQIFPGTTTQSLTNISDAIFTYPFGAGGLFS